MTPNQSNTLLRRYYEDRQNRRHLDRPEVGLTLTAAAAGAALRGVR